MTSGLEERIVPHGSERGRKTCKRGRLVAVEDPIWWQWKIRTLRSMKVMFPDGKLKTCLIPIAVFLNHSLYPHILHFGKIDPTTNSFKFRLSRPCSAGEQCFLSYGNFSSSHLITLLDPR